VSALFTTDTHQIESYYNSFKFPNAFLQYVTFDSYMSYLPLAHIYERTNQVVSVYYGVAIGFYQGVCVTFEYQV
jgi:long-subunit acyl-CoA synthetase (AMP-forming)